MEFKILIVDDDSIVLFIHKQRVRNSGFHCEPLLFRNGKEALDYLIADDSPFTTKILLLDINMPVMDGWALLDALQEHTFAGKVTVAIVSSSINQSDKQKASQYPWVVAYFEKPLTDENIEFLRTLVTGS